MKIRLKLLAAVCLAGTAATTLFASSAQASTVGGAVKSVTVTQMDNSTYRFLSVHMTWCVPDTSQAGDTFTLALPPQLTALTKGFAMQDPSGKTVANAKVAADLATFTLTDYLATHIAVCGTAYFDEAFNLNSVPANKSTTVTYRSGGTDFTTVLTPRPSGVITRGSALKFGAWTNPTAQDSITPVGALHWMIDTPQAPPGGYSNVVFADTSGLGQAFDCPTLTLSIGTPDTLGIFSNGVAVPSSHYVNVCSASGIKVTATAAVPRGELLHLSVLATVTDPHLNAYTDTASVGVNRGVQQTSKAQAVLRTSAGGNGAGTLRTTGVVLTPPSKVVSTPPSGFAFTPPSPLVPLAVTGTPAQLLLSLAVSLTALGVLLLVAASRMRPTPREPGR